MVLVRSFADRQMSYVDDQDEILQHIPEGVTVLKIRNGGNYDYEDRKWLHSEQTGKLV